MNLAIKDRVDELHDTPIHNEYLTVTWPKFFITADWHNPLIHKKLFKKLIVDAEKNDIRKLCIGGDFFDLNCFSKFFCFNPIPWDEERAYARKVMDILEQVFDEIIFIASNHEKRWVTNQVKQGASSITDPFALTGITNRSCISIKNQLEIVSPIGTFAVTHPKNARKQQLSLAREISNVQRDKHIVVTHAHMGGMSKTPCGNYFLIDCGCMCDPAKVEYKSYNVTAHYAWNPSYVMFDGEDPVMRWA